MIRTGRGSDQRVVDIACRIMRQSERAVAVADGTEEDYEDRKRLKWFWLPLSQIEIEKQPDGTAIVTMPEWLAEERGLI